MINKLKEKLINLKIRKLFVCVLKQICLHTKMEDKSAVFISHPDFCDNVYPIYVDLKMQGYKCLWVLNYKDSVKTAKAFGDKYIFNNKNMVNMFRLSKYHYFFSSHYLPYMYDKKGQVCFNLWHGSPFKVYHGVQLDNRTDEHYFVPSGEGALELYLENYGEKMCRERCIPYRHFRTDYFIPNFQTEERDKIERHFHLSQYQKTVLVCLTWIRDKEVNAATNNLLGFSLTEDEFDILNSLLNTENILLIIKPHPGQKVLKSFSYSNIRIVSSFELTENALQLYALIGMSDILLTDYSSILFDYALLNKPVGHIIHHWDYFTQNENEEFIYKNPEEIMFGTKIHSLDALCSFIVHPSSNDEEKRMLINKRYNEDPSLTVSSTEEFIKKELMK